MNFQERFKGKMQIIDKNGMEKIVVDNITPIFKPSLKAIDNSSIRAIVSKKSIFSETNSQKEDLEKVQMKSDRIISYKNNMNNQHKLEMPVFTDSKIRNSINQKSNKQFHFNKVERSTATTNNSSLANEKQYTPISYAGSQSMKGNQVSDPRFDKQKMALNQEHRARVFKFDQQKIAEMQKIDQQKNNQLVLGSDKQSSGIVATGQSPNFGNENSASLKTKKLHGLLDKLYQNIVENFVEVKKLPSIFSPPAVSAQNDSHSHTGIQTNKKFSIMNNDIKRRQSNNSNINRIKNNLNSEISSQNSSNCTPKTSFFQKMQDKKKNIQISKSFERGNANLLQATSQQIINNNSNNNTNMHNSVSPQNYYTQQNTPQMVHNDYQQILYPNAHMINQQQSINQQKKPLDSAFSSSSQYLQMGYQQRKQQHIQELNYLDSQIEQIFQSDNKDMQFLMGEQNSNENIQFLKNNNHVRKFNY